MDLGDEDEDDEKVGTSPTCKDFFFVNVILSF